MRAARLRRARAAALALALAFRARTFGERQQFGGFRQAGGGGERGFGFGCGRFRR